MGLFDFLIGGDDAQIKRHAKRMTNINAQHEDRMASSHWLADNGSDEAIIGLLGRFSMTIENHMKDSAEKELAYGLLVDLGPKIAGPIKTWLKTNLNIAQPLRLLEQFEGNPAVVGLLIELLAQENDPFKTNKKKQLLLKLAERRDPRITPAVTPLLRDFDEGIRYAAVEVLLYQDDAGVAEALAAHLAYPDEDSNRVRARIAEAVYQRRWTLGEHAAAVAARPPHGWQVVGDRMAPEG